MLLGSGFFLSFRRNLFNCWLWGVGRDYFFDWIFAHVDLPFYPGMFKPLAGSGSFAVSALIIVAAGSWRILFFV
jgi:hypothetical protein